MGARIDDAPLFQQDAVDFPPRMAESVPPDPSVIVANLHFRYTGVTASSRAVTPLIARKIKLAWFGSDAPAGVERLSTGALLRLRKAPRPIVWHARRNNEMIAGLLFKKLGVPLKMIFTSAAQRRHEPFTRLLIRSMDAIIAPSAAAASFLQRPATIVHHGVDVERYKPPPDRAAAWAEAKLPGRYAIGCFGRVRRQKGTDVFVEAMCAMLPRHPEWTAVIVGQATPDQAGFLAELRQRAQAAGLAERIVFLGQQPIDEVPQWFGRISVFAFTSRSEGFGLTLLEAMAAGNAVVASRAGAAEVVIEDGTSGVLVPPGDAGALAEALEPLLSDAARREEFGTRARERVVGHFSLEAEAQGINAVYRSLLGTEHARAVGS